MPRLHATTADFDLCPLHGRATIVEVLGEQPTIVTLDRVRDRGRVVHSGAVRNRGPFMAPHRPRLWPFPGL